MTRALEPDCISRLKRKRCLAAPSWGAPAPTEARAIYLTPARSREGSVQMGFRPDDNPQDTGPTIFA